jgi:hypothetical protein
MSKRSRWMGGSSVDSIVDFRRISAVFFVVVIEWRKRYMILKGTKVFFSKVCTRNMYLLIGLLTPIIGSQDAASAPHGIIDLVDCVSVKVCVTTKN